MPIDRQTIDDQHFVPRYLADQLSDEDREAFEAYCREHPEMFRELETTARVKAGLAALEKTGRLEETLSARPAGVGAFVQRYAAGIAVVGVGVAVLAGVGILRAPAMGSSVAQVSGRFGAALQVDAKYELVRMRKPEEFDLQIELPTPPAAIRLNVMPDEGGAASYRATLSNDVEGGSEKLVATVDGLVPTVVRPDEPPYVTLFIRTEKLEPGAYSLVVEREDGKPTAKQPAFRIEVTRK